MPKDVVAELEKDHREVEKLFSRWERARDRVATSRGRASVEKTFGELRRELSIHAEAEEMVLYPELRTAMPGRGEALADDGLVEHQRVKRTLATLEGLDAAEPEFARRMEELVRDVRHHVEEEERKIFAEMPKHLPPERMRELGGAIRRSKSAAPTHPHPSAPNRPPANLVVGMIAGAIDRLRDTFSGESSGGESAEPRRRRRASSGSSRAKKTARKTVSASGARKGPKSKASRAKTAAPARTSRGKAGTRAKAATRAEPSSRTKMPRTKTRPRAKLRVATRARAAGAKKARAKKK
jgi:hemerythrin superfamily protein